LPAGIVALVQARGTALPESEPGFWVLASITGISFILGFVLLGIGIGKIGISLATSVVKLSSIIPTLLSIFVFAEIPKPLQIAGICVAVACLPLASREPPWRKSSAPREGGRFVWVPSS
jgi:drug/metabolite transporter (DMT)-like permease